MTFATATPPAEQMMAKAGKTFYRAAALLPRSVRADVFHLYVFCRQVDDLADEPGVAKPERRRVLHALAASFAKGDLSQLRAASWPFAAGGPVPAAARLLVEAAAQDLQQQQPQSSEELLSYAFGVAGTVGIMMAHLLRAKPEGFRAAVSLGMAMQLSNIARDVAEDFENGRVYLPADRVSAQAVRTALHVGAVSESPDSHLVLAATAHVLTMAESLYESAFNGIWSLPWRIRWSILAAALCYREIGREVGRRGHLSWSSRVVISGRRKLWLITLAGMRLLLPRFWAPPTSAAPAMLGLVALTNLRQLGVA